MTSTTIRAAILVFCALLFPGHPIKAQGRGLSVTIEAVNRSYHNAPVSVKFPIQTEQDSSLANGFLMLLPPKGGAGLKAQAESDGKTITLRFILDDLPKGMKRTYRMSRIVFIKAPDRQVDVHEKMGDVEVLLDGRLFTRYATKLAPNKPIFYPLISPEGDSMTRRWPVEPEVLPGESRDHPPHRGLWFTHGSINGIDFWSEQGTVGRTINTGFDAIQSGWVYGSFRAKTEWRAPDQPQNSSYLTDQKSQKTKTNSISNGALIATDTREIRVYFLPNGERILDFNITLFPVGKALTFGDTKEGTFGMRLPDSLTVTPDKSGKITPTGHIESSTGALDAGVWGKTAEWVDCWGVLNDKLQGVALFDAPSNLRHPQTWHTRTYGLFAINPFGLHDFKGTKGREGEYTVPLGKSLSFSYRLLFHRNDPAALHIEESYAAFVDPPRIEVHR